MAWELTGAARTVGESNPVSGRYPVGMIDVVPLDVDSWPALEALFREGGDPKWCWCQWWRMRSKDFAAAKVPELRARLHSLAEGTVPPGLVALDRAVPPNGSDTGDGSGAASDRTSSTARAVGWVSLGPRADFERIVRSKVILAVDDRPVWSIVCFAVSASARGRGVARALLEGAITHARDRGAEALEAYPVVVEDGRDINVASAFTGTLPMFEKLGFRVVAERASDPSASRQRVVVRRDLREHSIG